MDELYVEVEIKCSNDKTEIFTTVQSFIALYVYKYLNVTSTQIKLIFVNNEAISNQGKLKINAAKFTSEFGGDEKVMCKATSNIVAIRDLKLPIYSKDGNTFIAGMCAVCRELVFRQNCTKYRELLGFKESCLLAPAEASIWTRFCEVNIVKAIQKLLQTMSIDQTIIEMPEEVPRFEQHMSEPVRMHNIYKLAREQANLQNQQIQNTTQKLKGKKNKVIIECSTPKEELHIKHRFAEGIAFTIADLILYPCFRLIFQHCPGTQSHFPLTHVWLSEVNACDANCERILSELYGAPLLPESDEVPFALKIPNCECTSLYKSDPKRYKPRNRIYTEQNEVDASLAKLETLQLEFNSDSDTVFHEKQLDWNTIEPRHAKSSALPKERLERKRQQLENLANAVVSLAEPGHRIVDFCSGTGHLGILLALQLPECTIILMENKAISLERAKGRAQELGLRNLCFYQCNIDYFEGAFDVGTSLHACGTATDIVLQQCLRSHARFVCCPCCYGSLQPMPHINYPLSRRFRTVLDERAFLHIAHTADQAHELGTLNCRPETTRQGQLCMDIVDTDRKLQAEEAGYEVILTRLKPEHCTPKNRLLVGRIVVNS